MPNIWDTAEWKAVASLVPSIEATHLRELFAGDGGAQRAASYFCEVDGLILDYSRQRVNPAVMTALLKLADVANVKAKIAALAVGEKVNQTEGRSALHMALRAPHTAPPLIVDGVDVHAAVHSVQDKIAVFSERVRSGEHVGATGKPLTAVVSIGIGGSYLGVEFVYEALRKDIESESAAQGRSLRFLANVDPVDVERALEVSSNHSLTLVLSLAVERDTATAREPVFHRQPLFFPSTTIPYF
jgi:glucose-6-phosphate isomerase